ncbi:MAG: thiamine pyrophosphate-binding protein [Nitrospirota bacterium]|nr:thiamine pyrophosphate-binding protein [Nitrospirota bacterium]
MRAIDILVKHLANEDSRYLFGIPGGALEPLYTAVHDNGGIKAILTKHEGSAAFMADGYARVSGRIGVCCGTTGPGSTNLITGIAQAYVNSVPVMALTAQVPTARFGKGAFQESGPDTVDIVDMYKACTKLSTMIINPERTGEITRRALKLATTGRPGPIHLNLPSDAMFTEVADDILLPREYRCELHTYDPDAITKAAQILISAKKPAMLLGHGVFDETTRAAIRHLAELLNMAVATTPKSKGCFPDDHPLSLGVFGFAGSPLAEEFLFNDNVDILLSVATSFNEFDTYGWDPRLSERRSIIQVDIDPTQFGKNYPCTLGLMGDAGVVLRKLAEEIVRLSGQTRRGGITPVQTGCAAPRYHEPEKMGSDEIPLKPQRLMHDLRESLPEDAIFFVDAGNNLAWAIHYLTIPRSGAFVSGLGFSSMGYGVAAAIGGKLAAPERPVVSIVGDGGFMMNGMEVATAVHYNIPVIWVVENNAQLGMVHHGQQMSANGRLIASDFPRVDFTKVAEGLGAKAYHIERPGEIDQKLMNEIIKSNRPTVLDVIIDAHERPPINSRIKALDKAAIKQ